MIAPRFGMVQSVESDTVVILYPDSDGKSHLTRYLMGARSGLAECSCGEDWLVKEPEWAQVGLSRDLFATDPWGARLYTLLSEVFGPETAPTRIGWSQPGRETLAFTVYLPDEVCVNLVHPETFRSNGWRAPNRRWEYGCQVVTGDGIILAEHVGVDGETALRLAVGYVAQYSGDVRVLTHWLAQADEA